MKRFNIVAGLIYRLYKAQKKNEMELNEAGKTWEKKSI